MDYEKTFNDSYIRVMTNSIADKTFFESFYEKFIQSSEEVAEKFKNTDLKEQERIIKVSLRTDVKLLCSTRDK